jgi:hypothetical protein
MDASNDARPAGEAVLGAAPGLIPPSLQVHSRTLAHAKGAYHRGCMSEPRVDQLALPPNEQVAT